LSHETFSLISFHKKKNNKKSLPFSRLFSFSHLLAPALSSDRDNYIKVNWKNIKEKAVFNFKQFVAHVSMFSTPYDYSSIMHYSPVAFAVDKSIPTLLPLYPDTAQNMGQREGKLLFVIRS
jgi:hypothetical protein